MENEFCPKCSNPLHLGSKGGYGSLHTQTTYVGVNCQVKLCDPWQFVVYYSTVAWWVSYIKWYANVHLLLNFTHTKMTLLKNTQLHDELEKNVQSYWQADPHLWLILDLLTMHDHGHCHGLRLHRLCTDKLTDANESLTHTQLSQAWVKRDSSTKGDLSRRRWHTWRRFVHVTCDTADRRRHAASQQLRKLKHQSCPETQPTAAVNHHHHQHHNKLLQTAHRCWPNVTNVKFSNHRQAVLPPCE